MNNTEVSFFDWFILLKNVQLNLQGTYSCYKVDNIAGDVFLKSTLVSVNCKFLLYTLGNSPNSSSQQGGLTSTGNILFQL